MKIIRNLLVGLFLYPCIVMAQAQISSTIEPDETKLRPGQYVWDPERATAGPAVIVVSLPDQMAYIYRNGILVGRTTVSTGRAGYTTPTGVFHILQKQRQHISDLYDASMPNMERLTWTGVALHAGGLPGYPSSHGCVHLPLQFSSLLYGITEVGTTVIITDSHYAIDTVEDPALLSSIAQKPTSQVNTPQPDTAFLWQPQLSSTGPISILITSTDHAIYVYRNGVLIGRSGVTIANPKEPLGYHVFTMLESFGKEKSGFAPDQIAHNWSAVTISSAPSSNFSYANLTQRVKIPTALGEKLYGILQPGTIIVIVDEHATAENTSEPDFQILTNNTPTKTK